MSELAFNVNGEPFEVPATASGWRVRRLKAKGAPEVVYGRDGLPLVLPIDADLDDLRAESGTPGRYRLDPIDETHKPIANGSAGYVFLHAAVRPTETTVPASTITVTSDSVVIEAMRMNSEIAKSVVDKFPQMLEAAATLLRAADGAGMPSRAARIEVTEVDEAEDETAEPTPPGADLLTTLATQLAPVLFQALSNKKSMTLDGVLDWRKAAPPKELAEAPKPDTAAPVAALPALDARTMAHVIAIQAALTPKEVAYVQEVARELPPAELRAWFDKLGKQSVSEAVETIRRLIAGDGKIGGAPVIGLPFNDLHCLGSITEVVAELVENRDPVIAQLAAKHRTTTSLAAWIRSLPQRDDDGDKCDGPKVETCEPPQRLRLPAEDPNCVERAALYVAVSELIDQHPVRQLATLDTPMGLHTFPVENGAPIILDPRVSKDCLECGVALDGEGPVAIEPIDAIEWTAKLAEVDSKQTRNGPSKVRRARNAVMRLADGGHVPTQAEVDAIGRMFALAEQAARRMGSRAVAMVRTTAQAIADLADEMIATQPRNLSIDFEGAHIDVPRWVSQLGKAAANVGVDVGAVALRSQLSELGIGDDMMGLVEQELNREGLTMGALARPPKLPTFANMNAKRAA